MADSATATSSLLVTVEETAFTRDLARPWLWVSSTPASVLYSVWLRSPSFWPLHMVGDSNTKAKQKTVDSRDFTFPFKFFSPFFPAKSLGIVVYTQLILTYPTAVGFLPSRELKVKDIHDLLVTKLVPPISPVCGLWHSKFLIFVCLDSANLREFPFHSPGWPVSMYFS